MLTNNVQNLKDEIPKLNQDEIKSLYVSSCEILKTFHRRFPPKTTEQELKVRNILELIILNYIDFIPLFSNK
jgi:hypothetical protein